MTNKSKHKKKFNFLLFCMEKHKILFVFYIKKSIALKSFVTEKHLRIREVLIAPVVPISYSIPTKLF